MNLSMCDCLIFAVRSLSVWFRNTKWLLTVISIWIFAMLRTCWIPYHYSNFCLGVIYSESHHRVGRNCVLSLKFYLMLLEIANFWLSYCVASEPDWKPYAMTSWMFVFLNSIFSTWYKCSIPKSMIVHKSSEHISILIQHSLFSQFNFDMKSIDPCKKKNVQNPQFQQSLQITFSRFESLHQQPCLHHSQCFALFSSP